MKLFDDIAKLVPTLEGWTSVAKAQTFAALILGYRPSVTVELGVWWGRGSLSMALAHREIGKGMVYAIDPWSAEASIEGQLNKLDREHWNNQPAHENAFKVFTDQIQKLGVQNCIKPIRARSSEAPIPEGIGLLLVDGNHGDEAVADVKRWAPKVVTGGFVYLDDLDWTGGAVRRAEAHLKSIGFKELYNIETGAFYQRI
jgi:predicted O-methyltransferase YrrM